MDASTNHIPEESAPETGIPTLDMHAAGTGLAPDAPDAPDAPAEAQASSPEVNHNLHDAEVTGYAEDGTLQYKLGDVVGTGYLFTPERAAEINAHMQKAPIGSTTRIYAPAE